MAKTKIIVAGKINKEGLNKVGKGLLIGLVGYILTEIAQLPEKFDFGEYHAVAVVAAGVLVNYGHKFMFPYESKK